MRFVRRVLWLAALMLALGASVPVTIGTVQAVVMRDADGDPGYGDPDMTQGGPGRSLGSSGATTTGLSLRAQREQEPTATWMGLQMLLSWIRLSFFRF